MNFYSQYFSTMDAEKIDALAKADLLFWHQVPFYIPHNYYVAYFSYSMLFSQSRKNDVRMQNKIMIC